MGRISESVADHKFLTAGLLTAALLLGEQQATGGVIRERATEQATDIGRSVLSVLESATDTRGRTVTTYGGTVANNGEVLFEETFDGTDATPYATSDTNNTHDKWFVELLKGTGFDRRNSLGVEDETSQFFRAWTKEQYGGAGEGLLVRMRVRTDSMVERPGNIHEGTKAQILFAAPDAQEEGAAKLKGDFDRGPGTYTFVFHTNDGFMEISKRKTGVDETREAYQFYESEQVPYEIGTLENIEWTIEWLEDGTNRLCLWRKNIQDDPIVVVRDTKPDKAMRGPGNIGIRTDDTQSSWDSITVERLESPRPGCE